jgi:hypothetical protein
VRIKSKLLTFYLNFNNNLREYTVSPLSSNIYKRKISVFYKPSLISYFIIFPVYMNNKIPDKITNSANMLQKNRKSCLQVFNILPWIYYWRIKDRLSLDVLDVSIYLYDIYNFYFSIKTFLKIQIVLFTYLFLLHFTLSFHTKNKKSVTGVNRML